MYTFMKKLVNIFICHILYRVEYQNIEEIQKLSKCLICPNHSNIFDPFYIFPKTDNLYIMAKSEIFKNKIIAKILTHYKVFPVKREKYDINATKSTIKILNNNKEVKLLIFPEGKVIKCKNEIGKVKNGAVFIAATTETPIVPVNITIRPKLFTKIKVKVGTPIFIEKEVLKNKEKLKEESNKLISRIYKINDKKII